MGGMPGMGDLGNMPGMDDVSQISILKYIYIYNKIYLNFIFIFNIYEYLFFI